MVNWRPSHRIAFPAENDLTSKPLQDRFDQQKKQKRIRKIISATRNFNIIKGSVIALPTAAHFASPFTISSAILKQGSMSTDNNDERVLVALMRPFLRGTIHPVGVTSRRLPNIGRKNMRSIGSFVKSI